MIAADAYLHIPEAYGRWLGGLRWSVGGEAVEFPDGGTFVFGRELSLFLDGFASGRDPIHFGHVLHLMHLLLRGPLADGRAPPIDLPAVFGALSRPHRNAGALCARLCDDVPGLPAPPDVEAVCLSLTAGAAVVGADTSGGDPSRRTPIVPVRPGRPDEGPDEPPLTPAEFERRVLGRLARLAPEQIRHWLRTGRAPEADARATAERVEAERPGSYREALEPLLDRPRLSGSAAMIDRLVGALALPPRRTASEALPTGGFADLTNRGHVERLLPSQHAIDAEEFLRRFAEHELLYFRREEPHAGDPEELVVLLDQGVRTWGEVRPVLAAAGVALARLADRRGLALRLAASSDPTRPVDPIAAEPEALAALLEASDLSPHPGPLLASALAGGSARRRDLVLLSHPRAVEEPEVASAARAPAEGDRLFAVLVDDRREVRLAELRRGRPVVLARFRAESEAEAERPEPAPPRRPAPPPPPGAWEGDVEPIGFPFRLPPLDRPPRRVGEPLIAFDESGAWFAAVGRLGVPHAWRLDGAGDEPLPRGFVGGEVVGRADALLGVAGGFVLIGRLGEAERPAAVHYDLASRRVRAYVTDPSAEPVRDWFYVRASHALIARGPHESWYVDLKTGGRSSSRDRRASEVVARDLAAIEGLAAPPPRLTVLHDDDTSPGAGAAVRLRRDSGTVTLEGADPPWRRFRPISDGRPSLAGHRLERALWRGRTLALCLADGRSPGHRWFLFRGPDPVPLPPRPAGRPDDLALSADGELVAVRGHDPLYAVYAVDTPGTPRLDVPRRDPAPRPRLTLGPDWMLLRDDAHDVTARWGRDGLHVESTPRRSGAGGAPAPTGPDARPAALAVAREGRPPSWASYDPRRFEATARGIGLVAVVDRFGQVVLADARGVVLGMLVASRGRLAAWMPDGTRFGPAALTGAPPTPGAAARLGSALRAASRGGSLC